MYKFRIILDAQEDVIREIAIARDFTLEELHQTIIQAFELDGNEMASFYFTDADWNQKDEIPLFNMNEQVGGLTQMRDYKIDFIFNSVNRNMLYVYDFFNLWTFFVEFISEFNEVEDTSEPVLILSVGDLPKEAPKKEFEQKKESFDFDEDEFNDPFDNPGNFDSLDDIDYL
jgi:hypothetical protein